ncbi:MAG: hypothetical protein QXV85_09475 [Candidatus Bathyarchaeia archaeon]
MSYKPAPRQIYGQRRKQTAFTAHHSFRQDWEANFDRAVAQAEALKDQGYLVEEGIQKGTLTESQAQRMAKHLQQAGFDVQFIPVASWAGEKIVFVVFKPPKEGAPIPQPRTSPKKKTSDVKTLMEKFVQAIAPEQTEPIDVNKQLREKGYVYDARYTIAFLPRDQKGTDILAEWARDMPLKEKPIIELENTPTLRMLVRAAKVKDKKKVIAFDSANKLTIRIENLQKVLRVFDDGPIRVYAVPGDDKPLIFYNDDGHAIAVARFMEAPTQEIAPLTGLLTQK